MATKSSDYRLVGRFGADEIGFYARDAIERLREAKDPMAFPQELSFNASGGRMYVLYYSGREERPELREPPRGYEYFSKTFNPWQLEAIVHNLATTIKPGKGIKVRIEDAGIQITGDHLWHFAIFIEGAR